MQSEMRRKTWRKKIKLTSVDSITINLCPSTRKISQWITRCSSTGAAHVSSLCIPLQFLTLFPRFAMWIFLAEEFLVLAVCAGNLSTVINYPRGIFHSHTHTRMSSYVFSLLTLVLSGRRKILEKKKQRNCFINFGSCHRQKRSSRNLAILHKRKKFHMWFLFRAPLMSATTTTTKTTMFFVQTFILMSRSRLRKILWQNHLKLSSAKRY